jgi:hypothetical protein
MSLLMALLNFMVVEAQKFVDFHIWSRKVQLDLESVNGRG